jgi:hypothetical protein
MPFTVEKIYGMAHFLKPDSNIIRVMNIQICLFKNLFQFFFQCRTPQVFCNYPSFLIKKKT